MCLSFFFSDKTAYFKWLQTSKELKGNGASGKRNSVSFLLTNVLRGMQAADPQNDQHRPLSKVGTTKSGENQKESSYVQFFFPIASLLRLGSLHFFTISVPAAALYPTTTFQIKVWRCLAYLCVRSKSNDTNLVRASTTALDIRFFSWIFSCS